MIAAVVFVLRVAAVGAGACAAFLTYATAWVFADSGWILRSRLELASLLICGVASVWLCVRFAAGHPMGRLHAAVAVGAVAWVLALAVAFFAGTDLVLPDADGTA